MSESSVIHLTINGKQVEGRKSQTILDVCRDAGIFVPTLCYHPRLSIVGACRMCMVEIEGNQKLQAACSTPAQDGMVIHTDTENLRHYRRLNLEFLFSERNHVCPFCESSGACDLQRLGYEHQMESIRFEYLTPRLSTDLSSPYFGLDHNRCILCTRCVRVCDEIEGTHTLDLTNRGGKTVVGVDLHAEFRGSTCTMCGACVQVCPTGALFDKMPSYRGRPEHLENHAAICPGCGVGCGLIAQTRYGKVIRVIGDESCSLNEGHACRIGRYESIVYDHKRVDKPAMEGRDNGLDWGGSLAVLKENLKSSEGRKTVLALTSRATLEACEEATALLDALGDHSVATLLDVDRPPKPAPTPDYRCLQEADVIWVVDCAPTRIAPVLASMIRRRVRKRQVRLIVCGRRRTELDRHASVVLDLKAEGVATLIAEGLGEKGVSVEGLDGRALCTLQEALDTSLRHVIVTSDRPDRRGRISVFPRDRIGGLSGVDLKVFDITAGRNTLGIASLLGDRLVDRNSLYHEEIGVLIAAVGDMIDERALDSLNTLIKRASSTFLFSSYRISCDKPPSVILPIATWWQEEGHVVNLAGEIQAISPVVPIQGDALRLEEAISLITERVSLDSAASRDRRRDLKTVENRLQELWAERKETAR